MKKTFKPTKKQFFFMLTLFLALSLFLSCNNEDLMLESEQVIEEEVVEEEEVPPVQEEPEEPVEEQSDIVLDEVVSTTLKAFPKAEGAGAQATGGRGGVVLHVTTLADGDQKGTLRWALSQTYPRIVVFDVSGTIKLDSYLFIDDRNNNLTVAGQTAPEGGITIEGPTVGFWSMNNVILRYIRFVNTSYFDLGLKGAAFTGSGSNNIILDHCSFRYSVGTSCVAFQDDNDQKDGQGNITVQRSIIGDASTGMLIGAIATNDSRSSLAGDNSVLDNLFINISHRFPNVSGNGRSEIINNVVYNYLHRLTSVFNESKVNIIGNYYKGGATSYAEYGGNFQLGTYINTSSFNSPQAYISDNIIKDNFNDLKPGADNWNNVVLWFEWNKTTSDFNREQFKMDKMPDLGPISIESPEDAYLSVIEDVGVNKTLTEKGSYVFYLDAVDDMYIRDVKNGGRESIDPNSTYSYRDNSDRSQLIYPELPTNSRNSDYDTDGDGMPDIWESAMGLNPMIDDSKEDLDGDGYTNVEEFLNLIDLEKK